MVMMVEVFKTIVADQNVANDIAMQLRLHASVAEVSFDLDDCDRILRVKGHSVDVQTIVREVIRMGYSCEVLE